MIQQTVDEILAIFHSALANPAAHIVVKFPLLLGEIPDDEALNSQSVAENRAHQQGGSVRSFGQLGRIILGD